MGKKKKYAVVTIKIGDIFAEMGNLTVPFMKNYADKIGADFVIIDKIKQKFASQYSAYWAKFELYELFDYYDRVFYIDLDTLVYPHCPDIFEIVPENEFGAFHESGDSGPDHTEEILEIQYRSKDINWRKDYFNVGVMVASKVHREAFNIKHGNHGGRQFPEQTQINYNVQRFNIQLFKLDYKYNHMHSWGKINVRDKSHIFHYAGITHEVRVALIREDIKRYHAGKPPLGLEELKSFFEKHFPGKDIYETIKEYRLIKDSEIGL